MTDKESSHQLIWENWMNFVWKWKLLYNSIHFVFSFVSQGRIFKFCGYNGSSNFTFSEQQPQKLMLDNKVSHSQNISFNLQLSNEYLSVQSIILLWYLGHLQSDTPLVLGGKIFLPTPWKVWKTFASQLTFLTMALIRSEEQTRLSPKISYIFAIILLFSSNLHWSLLTLIS